MEVLSSSDESAIAMRAIVDEGRTFNVITSQGFDKIKKFSTQTQDISERAESQYILTGTKAELRVSAKNSPRSHKETFCLARSATSTEGPEMILGSNSRVKMAGNRNDVALLGLAPSTASR